MRFFLFSGLTSLLAAGAAMAFSGDVHGDLTMQIGKRQGYDAAAAARLRDGNLDTDKGAMYCVAAAHFDSEQFAAGSARLREKLKSAIDNLARGKRDAALLDIGSCLHSIQDFFAHSNFVELGNLGRAINMLDLKNPEKGLTCKPGGTFARSLTSGYWTMCHKGEGPRVPGKCMHSQLNKDGPGAGDRHTKAKMRALEECGAFLKKVDGEIRAKFRNPEPVIRWLKVGGTGAPGLAKR